MLCAPHLRGDAGVPQPTGRSAPLFHPYVALPNERDPVAVAVGRHRYIEGAPKYHHGYDNPAAHGLPPVYLVLPPLGDVLLVRVQDHEGSAEDRDPFSGAYLSIRDGAVADPLDEGCTMGKDYVCRNDQGDVVAGVSESRRFVRARLPTRRGP